MGASDLKWAESPCCSNNVYRLYFQSTFCNNGKGVAARISRDSVEKLLTRIHILSKFKSVPGAFGSYFFVLASTFFNAIVHLSRGFFVLSIESSLHA